MRICFRDGSTKCVAIVNLNDYFLQKIIYYICSTRLSLLMLFCALLHKLIFVFVLFLEKVLLSAVLSVPGVDDCLLLVTKIRQAKISWEKHCYQREGQSKLCTSDSVLMM